jgi:class 3 adenylate cyclase/tetratricopeptide (TPR) repeat protein
MVMICSRCGTENREGRKFCRACGVEILHACASCGSINELEDVFCGECGAAIAGTLTAAASGFDPAATSSQVEARATPASGARLSTELRHVSVLFCDLVGFTPLSESKDPEEVRELLSGYFDLARGIVGRYGGRIEKFVGDAVMAVWGAPVATEDDAERAVRAALELILAISAYGDEHGTKLEVRAGVVTGGAATTETPEEGMVIGDSVNTAARIQSVAPAGCCFVDQATRHATSASIAYRDAGEHTLKGKTEPVVLHQALRVTAGVGGALKSTGLEAPFVGRDHELRFVKELFHGSALGRRPHLVSVTGMAGIGKSRLAWEFYKYMDGLSDAFNWHRGRCLSYGDGITYWALADMVRGRAGIVEGEDAESAAAKLQACLQEYLSDPEERRWVMPRLAHLIGVEDRSARDQEDLFSAWRLFFERMSEVRPVVLSFEDMQWADSSLLDFIDYLLDWSRSHAIFVLTLSRPQLVERRPSWGTRGRNFTAIYLDPLERGPMSELVAGLVPGLPDAVRDQILERAEGVPLYAVETVRMLIDRGLLIKDGEGFRLEGSIGSLDIPETLHALIAARLDGLTAGERALLQDAAVAGKTFSKDVVAALGTAPLDVVDELLASLVRKDVLTVQSDPRSSDRGQYSFLQDLVRAVAYETLPKRDRKAKHLAVATRLREVWSSDEDEIVEVLASHYLDAYRLAPSGPDSAEVRACAVDALTRAGERTAKLAAAETARGYFELALELTDDAAMRPKLAERAGECSMISSHVDKARAHYLAAIGEFEVLGQTHDMARVSARLGEVDYLEGRLEQGVERMDAALSSLADEQPDADVAMLAAQLGRLHVFSGAHDIAAVRLELALSLAERFRLPETMSQAMNTKGVLLGFHGRYEEGTVLLQHALKLALDNDLSPAALRAYGNLAAFLAIADRNTEARALTEEARRLARRVGDRVFDLWFVAGEAKMMMQIGDWEGAEALYHEVFESEEPGDKLFTQLVDIALIFVHQGRLDEARAVLNSSGHMESTPELQYRASFAWVKALVLRWEGDLEGSLAAAAQAVESRLELGVGSVKMGLIERIESAFMADLELAEELVVDLENLAPGETTPFLVAQAARFRAQLSPDGAGRSFASAVALFEEMSIPFWAAVTRLEFVEWLIGQGRDLEANQLLTEARESFERLHARPWLDRLSALSAKREVSA